MRSKFKWIYTLVLAFAMQFSFAQEKTITGTVTDGGMPLPGASVLIKGTTAGTETDFNGKYTIKAKVGQELEFSFIGMKKQTIKVGASNSVNVAMEADTKLEEVVVVGYGSGTTKREALTGTATAVKTENLQAKTFSNISQALRGEVAGVNVIQNNGQPGAEQLIRIRGFGSVNGNRNPLYVVDGVPFTGNISAINQADVENMTILKDAASISIYGSRGANGVILITTKKGKNTKSEISVDVKTSINTFGLPFYETIDSPEEYIEISWQAVKNRASVEGQIDPIQYANFNLFGGTNGISPYYNIWNTSGNQLIDSNTGKFKTGISRKYEPGSWSDIAFKTGLRQEANLQISGANEKTNHSFSLGYINDEGTGVNSDYRRYTGRLNLSHKVREWLKIGTNISYAGDRSTSNGQSSDSSSIFLFASNTPAIYSPYLRDAQGNTINDPKFGGAIFDYGDGFSTGNGGALNNRRFSTSTNAIGNAKYNLNRNFSNTLFGNFSADINLYKGLTFETKYGIESSNYEFNTRENPFYGPASSTTIFGRLRKVNDQVFNANFLKLLRYRTTFGSTDNHSLEVFIAHETTQNEFIRSDITKQNAILLNTLDLDQYTTANGKASSYSRRWAIESYFSQLNYNFDQKYFLSASIRRDGSSRFRNEKWGTFWSVGAGWVLSKESFLSNSKSINYLKLKGSYGVIGDQGERIRYGWQIFEIGDTDAYSFTPSLEQGNPNLTWETSKMAQVGFESTFFNRVDLNVDYYIKNTDNLFFQQSLPGSSGFSQTFVNSGQLRNSGLEFDINVNVIKEKEKGGFKLDLGINGEMINNKITAMPIDLLTGKVKVFDDRGGSDLFPIEEGRSVFDFYMREWAGVDPGSGAGLWNLYYNDKNSNGLYDSTDEPILNMVTYQNSNPNANIQKTTTDVYARATEKFIDKSAIPKIRGAFRIKMAYKSFDLSTQFSYSYGGYAYDSQYAGLMVNDVIGKENYSVDIRDRWQKPGDITNVPRVSDGLSQDADFARTSTRFITKSDFISLNNVRLGYTFDTGKLKNSAISMLNIYISGDNLMVLSHRKGFNPATSESGNSNVYRYNPVSNYTLGVKINF
jgi:TonB-linked SusC/RagA family outer membrane protein